MFQKEIDAIAKVVVFALASPFVVMMTAIDRYGRLLARNPTALKIHECFLVGLVLIVLMMRK